MDYPSYLRLFENLLNSNTHEPPYTDPQYLHFTRLNLSRMTRWQKNLQLNDELVAAIRKISHPQQWIIITEPWCGDAAPIVPFLVKLAEQNPLFRYDLQLRDSAPFLINDYLTNGSKSIPKLIVRDAEGNDLFTYGPRPAGAQQLVTDLKAAGTEYEVLKTELQNWYNRDKGVQLQRELLELIEATAPGA